MNETLKPSADERIIRTHMAYELDSPIGHRAKIGLLVLASDHTVEYEWRKVMALDGVAFYESRLYNSPTISPETLAAMANEIGKAASLILPGVDLDVVAYGCTSGAMTIGEEKVFELIRAERPNVACTTPITAAFAGFERLGVKRIALLTPYAESVNEMMRAYIEARGVAVPVSGSFNEEDDNKAARISQRSIHDAALELGQSDRVEAVFVSCTSLQVSGVVATLEEALGKPVMSSNLAMAWHALRLAGVGDTLPGYGRLFAS
jgi:maleate isomerase